MANKYLVISPNDYGNVGDDICAYAGKKAIEIADPGAKVAISQPPMKLGLMKRADYVVLSGGGILYDRAPANVNNYMQYIDRAVSMHKKAAVLGVGVQGIVTEKGAKRYQRSLNKCEFVSVRTEEDKQLLDKIGFKSSVPTFDIAYFMPEAMKDVKPGYRQRKRSEKILSQVKKSKKPKIGICMINLKMLKRNSYEKSYKPFDDAIESFIERGRQKFDIYLLQHAGEDAKVMKPLADKYGVTYVPYTNIGDVPALFELYKNMDAVVGVRLHSIAMAIMAGVPVVGIGSKGAKQLRLARYGLKTLEKQFYGFNQVKELRKLLDSFITESELPVKKLSKKEYDFIETRNQKNVDLLREMISE